MLNCSQVLQRPAMTHAPPADVLVSSPLLPHLMTGVPSMTRRPVSYTHLTLPTTPYV